eukprot:TRINITY_DN10161_c0_g1_i1.p1 TRINITY_DN10161_c0_g1~~TRINITY_DN10161_c0_g1_i1.p1  ORF type:complete len:179 (+),score=17.98 TRINITY_DN10161_c0_g1_i1:137-673(+)
MQRVYELFEQLALRSLKIIFQRMGINTDELLGSYGDPTVIPVGKVSTSVFNVYHYFNTADAKELVNCRQHVDPGLITVLGRGTMNGLEIRDSFLSDDWISIEKYMTDNEVVVIAGETLNLVSGGRIKGGLHWVNKSEKERLNLTFEMRTAFPIYWPWGSENELRDRHLANTKRLEKFK